MILGNYKINIIINNVTSSDVQNNFIRKKIENALIDYNKNIGGLPSTGTSIIVEKNILYTISYVIIREQEKEVNIALSFE